MCSYISAPLSMQRELNIYSLWHYYCLYCAISSYKIGKIERSIPKLERITSLGDKNVNCWCNLLVKIILMGLCVKNS